MCAIRNIGLKCWQDLHFKLKLILAWFVLFLIVFSAARYAVYYFYHPVFAALTAAEVWRGFIQGIRFDLSIVSFFCAPLVLVLLLPIKSPKYIKTVYVLWCILFVLTAGILTGDFIYFPEAKRHLAEEVLTVRNEIVFLLRVIFLQYWPALLGLVLSFFALLWAGMRWISRSFRPAASSWWKTGTVCVLAAGLLFLGIRGHLGRGKPLSIRSLNLFSTSGPQAVLMMNGVFSLYHSTRKTQSVTSNPMPEEEAWQTAREILSSSNEKWTNDSYPLSRKIKNPRPAAVKNVFIVLLESWTPKYIDSFNLNGRKYGVTPNFDRIASGGVRFTQAFAVGVRSIFGLTSTFAGIPLVSGLTQFSDGLELNNVTYLARLLRQKGYYTAFMQSSKRSSYQMCSMATHIFGFEESYGMEDFPRLMDYTAPQGFGWDYDLLSFAADKASAVAKQGKPFFIFTFTGTTHTPFASTTSAFDKYPRTSDENKYLNTLAYADYAIGTLLEKARQEGWLKDTVFVFMSDHTISLAQQDDELYTKFRIPFVIYAPEGKGVLKAREVDYPVSQLDLIPTLFHLLGLNNSFSAIGNDALDASAPHFAFITEGTNIAFIMQEGFVRHDRARLVESSSAADEALKRRLTHQALAIDKSVTSLLHANQWALPSAEKD
ncbi:MAG: LTA synthase family protein [Candidatus Avelusimicrobium sp.]|uniref:LTA synthase family protein n=1 Tax=Candidatus Avelusimicrobium sp. TaxID=3048833 RepID=UPI003F10AD0F